MGPKNITDLSTPYCSPIKDLLIPQNFLEIGCSQNKLWPLKVSYEIEKTPINSPRFLSEIGQFGPGKITNLSTPYCSPIKYLLIPQTFLEIGSSQNKLWPLKVSYKNSPHLEKTLLMAHAFCQKLDSLSTPYCSPIKDLLIPKNILGIGRSQNKLCPLKVSYENRPDLEKTPSPPVSTFFRFSRRRHQRRLTLKTQAIIIGSVLITIVQ